jgi:hypothetical protein
MTKDMHNLHNLLQTRTDAVFGARVSLCKLLLAQVKALPNSLSPAIVAGLRGQAEHLTCEMIFYSHRVKLHTGISLIPQRKNQTKSCLGRNETRVDINMAHLLFAPGANPAAPTIPSMHVD